ncbi:hypothetical protein FOA43_001537 [Brettanomyces nanus]|uniref:J domain-containing protein n=1 Tax=Eeniella nana TaxID=13502 RepID=A0A875RZX3_EENNA|nr:uncharacterized protein FOA43_001537 [Brettanomyces nanus]QPG74213.1 hypothetical protein FOA43_001537 [Brettanomyces nanus]
MEDEEDYNATLKKEELELIKDKEIQRILSCFRLDYYTILDTQPGIAKKDISKIYRKKSLLIHPDKTNNPKAVDAFDLLRKASRALEDDKERLPLDSAWTDARRDLIQEKGWTISDDRLLKSDFLIEWRAKVKEVLIEEEFAKKVALKREQVNESRKRKMEEERQTERQVQKEIDKNWESHRSDRVESWKKFSKKIDHKKSKKKKKKAKLLI